MSKTKNATPATPAKKPAKQATKATPASETPAPTIKVTKSGSTDSLSGTGVLSYEVGTDDAGDTLYRISANSAGGFFSGEWVAWSKIYAACEGHSAITSILFRGLFRGKSVNTAGFMLAVTMKEGLIQRKAGKARYYELTEAAHKLASANAA